MEERLDGVVDSGVQEMVAEEFANLARQHGGKAVPVSEFDKLVHDMCVLTDLPRQTVIAISYGSLPALDTAAGLQAGEPDLVPPLGSLPQDSSVVPEVRAAITTVADAGVVPAEAAETQSAQVEQGEKGMSQYSSVADVVRAHASKSNAEIRAICDKHKIPCGVSTISVARAYMKKQAEKHAEAGKKAAALPQAQGADTEKKRRGRPAKKAAAVSAPAPGPAVPNAGQATVAQAAADKPKPLAGPGPTQESGAKSPQQLLADANGHCQKAMKLVEEASKLFSGMELELEKLRKLAPYASVIQALQAVQAKGDEPKKE